MDEVSYTIPAMAKQVTLHPSSPDMHKIGKIIGNLEKKGKQEGFHGGKLL